MQTRILMRHGKAADGMQYTDDFERPLEPRGKTEVLESAKTLRQEGIIPDVILSSPACRAASTARIVAEVFGIDPSLIVYHAPLYMSDIEVYVFILNLFKGKSVLLVGHNPFIEELAAIYTNHGVIGCPTSSAIVFEFPEGEITLNSSPKTIFVNLRK